MHEFFVTIQPFKLIGYEHIVGLHPGAAADENTRLHRFRLHRGAALH